MNTQALGLLGELPLGLTCSVSLLLYFLMACGYWYMFAKAQVPSWKCFIPFYNTYIAYTISWEKGKSAFFAVLALGFASFAFLLVNASTAMATAEWYISYVAAIVSFGIACIIHAVFCIRQALSFDRSAGYAALAFFFYPLMMMYYGLSKSVSYYAPVD